MGARISNPPQIRPYIKVSDVKAQNTPGGTFTQGAWQTRTLNTEDSDTHNHCSLNANRITLTAGTYECHIIVPAHVVGSNQARLQNITGAVTILLGISANSNIVQSLNVHSFIVGRFTIAASQALEIQHICAQTRTDDGFGNESNFASEVYAVAEFWKIQ